MNVEKCLFVCVFSFRIVLMISFLSFYIHCDFYSTCCSNNDSNTRSSTSRLSTTKYSVTWLSSSTATTRVNNFNANRFCFPFPFSIDFFFFAFFVYVTIETNLYVIHSSTFSS